MYDDRRQVMINAHKTLWVKWAYKGCTCTLSNQKGQVREKKNFDLYLLVSYQIGGRRGHDHHMVVEFTTTYMQSVPITTNVVSSIPALGKVY